MNNSKKEDFCESIKNAQIGRFVKAGFSKEEAEKNWINDRNTYLHSWREYVDSGLVELPKDLDKLSSKYINKVLRRRLR